MNKLLLLGFVLIHSITFSQKNSEFNKFVHLSSVQGLSQNSVFCFEQDDLDQMWVGTRDGLNKYDGEKITVYRNIQNDSTSISNNDIRCILKDNKGFLWVGTQKGLSCYNPRSNTFKNFFYSPNDNSISNNQITSIAQLKNGDLWIGTSDGLSIYDQETNQFTNYRNNNLDHQSLSSNYITEIFQDVTGVIWVGTTQGLNRVVNADKFKLRFKKFYLPLGAEKQKGVIQSLEVGPDKNLLWVGTRGHGLFMFDTVKNIFFRAQAEVANKVTSKDIRSICYDTNHNLWLATYDGLFVVKNNEVVHVTNQYGNPKSLSRNTLKKVFVDRRGSVWIGAYYGGANIWNPYSQNFDKVFRVDNNQAYPLGVVSFIEEDKQGNVYFGTESKGITVMDRYNNTNKKLTNALNRELEDCNVKSLLIDENKLWIATFNNGIKLFDLTSKTFEGFGGSDTQVSAFLKNIHLYSIARVDDLILFGTFGQGVVVYNLKTEQIATISANLYSDNSLTNNRVRVLLVDTDKNLWIGTESGLNKISYANLRSKKYEVQRFLFDSKHYFGSDIASIIQNKQGQVYVGTKEKGLFVFQENQFKHLPLEAQNTTVQNICTIVESANDNLWISNNYGLLKYNTSSKKTVLYSQIDGLIGQEFNNNSGKKISTGEVYFGGVFGASVFDPNLLGKTLESPQVILTNLKVEGKDIANFDTKNSVLSQSVSYTNAIELNHNQSSFSLNFAMPSYHSASNNKYQYRLVGLDDVWKFSSTPEVNYSIQKSGSFTFEVKGVDSSLPPTKLLIEVTPAPWKTPLAFVVYFLMIALALYGLNYIKESRSKLKHRLELQSIEKQQQEQLNKSKLEFFTNISHEFRTPLSLILGPLQQVIENYQGSNKIYKRLQVIQQNADQLLKLINQLLDFRKFENENSKLQAAEGNIVKFLREIYLSFFEFSKVGNYEYTFSSSSDNLRVYFDRHKLERVFYNLISNAFKYTPEGGKIEVNIIEQDEHIVIQVKDNGKGVDKQFVGKIFERFYEVAADKKYQKQFNQASGIGLSIAKKAVDLHQGKIEIQDQQDKGSTFVVTLLKGQAHLSESDIIKNFKISDDVRLYESQLKTTQSKELNLSTVDEDSDKQLVLIAEDNDGLRDFIADILKEQYRVITAENGRIAFKKALQFIPDLIISDVIMPEMEGTELCAKIKTDIRTSHIPLVLLTSRTSLVYKFDGLESGADAYINKPFNVKEFMLTVNNLLSFKQKVKEKFLGNTVEFEHNSTTSIDEQLLSKAVNIVKKNIDNTSFNIPSFSAELGVSRTILFAKIKNLTNLTPNEFIHSIRMKRAAELLELGQINVSEVCYKVGFRNPKYFTKCFKKHFNQTPTEYASMFYV